MKDFKQLIHQWQRSELTTMKCLSVEDNNSFMLSALEYLAADLNRPTALIPHTCDRIEIAIGMITKTYFSYGKLNCQSADDWREKERRIRVLLNAPMHIPDIPVTPDNLYRLIRYYVEKEQVEVVLTDFGMILPIEAALRSLAEELNIAIVSFQ
jgi:hypothetical protein